MNFLEQPDEQEAVQTSSRIKVWWLTRVQDYRIVRIQEQPRSASEWCRSRTRNWLLLPNKTGE